MQQGDGGGLRYAMQTMQVLRKRGQPPVSQRASLRCSIWLLRARIRQRIRPTTTRSGVQITQMQICCAALVGI